MKKTLLALTVSIFSLPALAEPIPMPQVDYEGEWQMDPAPDIKSARIHYSAALKAFRIDMETPVGAMSMVRDLASGEMTMWGMMGQNMAMKMKAPSDIPDVDATGEKEEVDGIACDVYQNAQLRICLAEDNIPLTATSHGTAVRLLNVRRTAQDATLFQMPEGLQIMELPPAMLKQMEQMQGNMPGKNALPF